MRDIQLDSGVTSKVYISPVSILRDTRVSSIIVRWNPIVFKLESLDRRCALKFFSLGTCSNLKYVECIDKLHTLWRYFISCGSLACYFPATWLATSWELIFAFNLEAPISREITMSRWKLHIRPDYYYIWIHTSVFVWLASLQVLLILSQHHSPLHLRNHQPKVSTMRAPPCPLTS